MTVLTKVVYWHFEMSNLNFKKKRLKIPLTQDRMGVKTSKPYSYYSSEASSTKLF